jgi:hypothetical protein
MTGGGIQKPHSWGAGSPNISPIKNYRGSEHNGIPRNGGCPQAPRVVVRVRLAEFESLLAAHIEDFQKNSGVGGVQAPTAPMAANVYIYVYRHIYIIYTHIYIIYTHIYVYILCIFIYINIIYIYIIIYIV